MRMRVRLARRKFILATLWISSMVLIILSVLFALYFDLDADTFSIAFLTGLALLVIFIFYGIYIHGWDIPPPPF